jgi:hypothetical protein
MRVRITLNLGTRDYPGHPYREGEERDVPDDLGAELTARGFAVQIASEVIKAIPDPPAIAKAAEPEVRPEVRAPERQPQSPKKEPAAGRQPQQQPKNKDR